MYIKRELENSILNTFRTQAGLLIPGIVGCGKTTLIEHTLNLLRNEYECFSFSGDETNFRVAVAQSGSYLLDYVSARTDKKSLVFVDEVQKEEAIFDAVKIAYDKAGISFIISGSNPEYLKTKATQRIQRRASLLEMFPFTPLELLQAAGLIGESEAKTILEQFLNLLLEAKGLPQEQELPEFSLSTAASELLERYLITGGLPLAWQAPTLKQALEEVKKVFERGFEPILNDTNNVSNIVAEALAVTHAQEFTYQGVMQRSRVKQRRSIVEAINALMAHGYIFAKEPWFPDLDHRSYITVYSYADPGIVSYLRGSWELEAAERGQRIEGICHSRLRHHLATLPVKTQLNFYKPYVMSGSNLRFRGGEIDFIARMGKRVIPLEAKAHVSPPASELTLISRFVAEHKLPFGIVLHGGRPKINPEQRLIYWPWFLL